MKRNLHLFGFALGFLSHIRAWVEINQKNCYDQFTTSYYMFFCPTTEAHSPKYGCGLARVKVVPQFLDDADAGTENRSTDTYIYIVYVFTCFFLCLSAANAMNLAVDSLGV